MPEKIKIFALKVTDGWYIYMEDGVSIRCTEEGFQNGMQNKLDKYDIEVINV